MKEASESDCMSKAHAAERDRDHVVADLNGKLSYLQRELDQVNARCDCELGKAAERRESELVESLEKARGERDQARFDWKAAEKRESELRTKVEALALTEVSLKRELDTLKSEMEVYEHAAEEATTLKKANEGFRHKLEVEVKEREVLLTRISEYSVALEKANETIAGRNKELRKAHLDELALQERVKELESDVEHQGKIIPSLTERVDHLRVENTRVHENFERAMGLLVSQYANEL